MTVALKPLVVQKDPVSPVVQVQSGDEYSDFDDEDYRTTQKKETKSPEIVIDNNLYKEEPATITVLSEKKSPQEQTSYKFDLPPEDHQATPD